MSTSMCLFFIAAISGCTKLDTTTMGSDLLPLVDNVNTFADTLSITTNESQMDDSLTKVYATDPFALGKINNDPLFGKTTSNIYFQFKPAYFPYNYSYRTQNSTLVAVDSVVLCLSYISSWGDSTLPQRLEVSQVWDNKFRDSVAKIRTVHEEPATGPAMVAQDVNIASLQNYVKLRNGDSVKNQIRIVIAKAGLNDQFMQDLIRRDTTSNTLNNALRSDSLFRRFYNGLAVKAVGTNSNSLMYISLADVKSRLEIHYRHLRSGATTPDTSFESFRLITAGSANNLVSATANNIKRDYSGTNVLNPTANFNHIQTAPGNFVNISVPGLSNLSNRIVHRAYLEVTQVPDNVVYDNYFSPPSFLYVDLKDTATSKWKPLYYDLNPSSPYFPDNVSMYFPAYGVDHNSFGGVIRSKPGPGGTVVKYYYMNMTHYVQQIVTNHLHNYDMRLWAPVSIMYPQYDASYYAYSNPVAYGRVRVGSGNNPNPVYRMKLVIIYSKL